MPADRDLAPITAEVGRQLRGRLRQFRIDRCGEGLVLSGKAPSFYVKQLALHAVRTMSRLRIVRNEIEVPQER